MSEYWAKPFNYEKIVEKAKEKYYLDIEDFDKMVMIGDEITTDVMFGNINKMGSIWITNHQNDK